MEYTIDYLHPLLLNIGLAVHDADWNWKNVISPFARIYYVEEGNAQVIFSDRIQDLRPGFLYFIPPFTLHGYNCESHFVHYYLHLYEDLQPNNPISLFDQWIFPTEIPAEKLEKELIQHLYEMNPSMRLPQSDPASYDNDSVLIRNILRNKQRAFCNKVESRGILYQLLAHFLKNAQPHNKESNDRIQRSLVFVQNNVYNDIQLKQMADIACMSVDHFIRLFKKEVGVTPLQYINQKKMEKAQLMLVTETVLVKDIAYLLGFNDYSYFIRLFKKIVGITPKQYREQNLT